MTPEPQMPEVDTGMPPDIFFTDQDSNQEQSSFEEDRSPIENPQQTNESLKDRVLRTKAGKFAVASVCSLAAVGVGASAASANERGPNPNAPAAAISSADEPSPQAELNNTPELYSSPFSEVSSSKDSQQRIWRTVETDDAYININGSKKTDQDIAAAIIVANNRTVGKAKIKNARQNDRCQDYTGEQAVERGIYTHGRAGGDVYAPENRFTTLCKVKVGKTIRYVRAQCGNLAKIAKPRPNLAEHITWINSWKKATLAVRATARTKTVARCGTDSNNYAYAVGYGAAWAGARVKVRSAMRSKGEGIKDLIQNRRGRAMGKAFARSDSSAVAFCKESKEVDIEKEQDDKHEKPKPKPKPKNQPPTGRLPLHERIVDTEYKVCADDLSDPNGDKVSVTDFRFTNPEGEPTGREIGSIYTEAGSDGTTQCQEYETPSTPQEVDVEADLSDGRGGETTLRNSMAVVDRGF